MSRIDIQRRISIAAREYADALTFSDDFSLSFREKIQLAFKTSQDEEKKLWTMEDEEKVKFFRETGQAPD